MSINKKKILIVEDNALNLKLFEDILTINNYDAVGISDGTKAIEKVYDFMPDLILMDIQLHGISGLDVIRNIKVIDDLSHIPIIAITAFAMNYDRDKILSSGCEGYISKPVNISDFLSIIGRFFTTNEIV